MTFGKSFDQSVDHLPDSLLSLTFGKSFNKHVNYLPKNIELIIFGKMFNKYILNECFVHFMEGIMIDTIYLNLHKDICLFKNNIHYNVNKTLSIKNENFSFKIKYISFEILHKIIKYSFDKYSYIHCNVKKIPYGCVYKYI